MAGRQKRTPSGPFNLRCVKATSPIATSRQTGKAYVGGRCTSRCLEWERRLWGLSSGRGERVARSSTLIRSRPNIPEMPGPRAGHFVFLERCKKDLCETRVMRFRRSSSVAMESERPHPQRTWAKSASLPVACRPAGLIGARENVNCSFILVL